MTTTTVGPAWEHALCRVLQGTRQNNPTPVPRGHLVLAQDLPSPANGKRYGTVAFTDLPGLLVVLPEAERCLYAMMTLCLGVDLYLDVENETVQPGATALWAQVRLWASLRDFLCRHGWEPRGLLVLRSDTQTKSSFHWHVRLDKPWRNVGHVAAVVRAWYEHLDGDLRLWVDHKVYDQNRCFRLMGCRKGGKRDGTLVALSPVELQGIVEMGPTAVSCLAEDLARLAPPTEEDAVRWSACVRPDVALEDTADAPVAFQQAKKIKAGAKGQLWDVAGAIERYAQDNAGWLTSPLFPQELHPDQGLKNALGERVSGGLTKATHFWGCKDFSTYYKPQNVLDVHRAMAARLSRLWPSPAFLNEAAGRDGLRRPWVDLDHLGTACATRGVQTADVLEACIDACARLITDTSCLLVMSGVPQGLCPPPVKDGCHLRFFHSRVGFAEHNALLVTVAQALEQRFGPDVAACVDPNCRQQLRTVWSDKAMVDEVSWSLKPANRVLRVHAVWTQDAKWAPWDEMGVMHDLSKASVLSDGKEPGEATELLVQQARHGQCRPGRAGKSGGLMVTKNIPEAAGRLVQALVNGLLAPLGCQANLGTAKLHNEDMVTLLSTPAQRCPAGANHKNPWPVHVMVLLTSRVAWLNCINTQTDANGHGPLKPRWTSGSVYRELDERKCAELLGALFPKPSVDCTQTETLAWTAVCAQLPPKVQQPGIARMVPRALILTGTGPTKPAAAAALGKQPTSAPTAGACAKAQPSPSQGFGFDWPISTGAQKEDTSAPTNDVLAVRFERQTVSWAGKQHRVNDPAFRDLALFGLWLLGGLASSLEPARHMPGSYAACAFDLCQLLKAEPVIADRLAGLCNKYAPRVLRSCGAVVRTNGLCAAPLCRNALLLCFLVVGSRPEEAVVLCETCGTRAVDWIDSQREREKAARNNGIVETQLLFSGPLMYERAHQASKLICALLSCAATARKRARQ